MAKSKGFGTLQSLYFFVDSLEGDFNVASLLESVFYLVVPVSFFHSLSDVI
jgi:hypothetical protein